MNDDPSKINRRILIIDDTPSIHADFRKVLERHPGAMDKLAGTETDLFGLALPKAERPEFELSFAFQGEEGMEILRKQTAAGHPFALAFVDVRMPPGLDGIETTARLWEIDPDLQVVICTAYSDYSWEEMSGKLGNPDRMVLLKKPFDTIEVLQLANALTEKWRLLQATKRRMDSLERLVAERTQHLSETNERLEAEIARRIRREQCLSLQNEVTAVLTNSTAAPEDLVNRILHLICEHMQWELGQLWLVDRHAHLLRCSAVLDTRAETAAASTEQAPLAPGSGLAGAVWRQGEGVWISDAAQVPEARALREEAGGGWRAALAFPLRLDGEILGVLEFRSAAVREREDAMLHMLATVGGLIGQAIERKKLEDQLRHSQKMDAIGHLAGGVAHDFNNILTVIQGYAQILKLKPGLDSESLEAMDQVSQAADRAAGLTRQLLTFSRKQILQPRPLDLSQVVAQIEKMLRRIIGEDIALTCRPAEEPAVVVGDEMMITQVLMNLACNARDAMRHGGQLTITTEVVVLDEATARQSTEARAGEFVCLRVSDTGCGISPEHLPHLFEPFFTTKEIGRGTGLGLCTVYGIVKQHHGWIEVATQLGRGTTFDIHLPRAELLPSAKEPTDLKIEELTGRETILLVEDEVAVRHLTKDYLERLGYQVIEAGSGVEALSAWEQHPGTIDLLLTDMVMPEGLNGSELAARLRTRQPGLRILCVSGYTPAQDGQSDGLLPADAAFLHKPYPLRTLAHRIRECLDRRAPAPQAGLTVRV